MFYLDLEHYPNCGVELKIIAATLEQSVSEKILTHLGLQARAPPRAPARGQVLARQPDAAERLPFRRPGTPGRWSRPRPSVFGTDGSRLATSDNPQTTPRKRTLGRRSEHSASRARLVQSWHPIEGLPRQAVNGTCRQIY